MRSNPFPRERSAYVTALVPDDLPALEPGRYRTDTRTGAVRGPLALGFAVIAIGYIVATASALPSLGAVLIDLIVGVSALFFLWAAVAWWAQALVLTPTTVRLRVPVIGFRRASRANIGAIVWFTSVVGPRGALEVFTVLDRAGRACFHVTTDQFSGAFLGRLVATLHRTSGAPVLLAPFHIGLTQIPLTLRLPDLVAPGPEDSVS